MYGDGLAAVDAVHRLAGAHIHDFNIAVRVSGERCKPRVRAHGDEPPRSKSFSLSTVNTARAVYAALSTAPPSKMRCSSGVMTRSLRMSSSVI